MGSKSNLFDSVGSSRGSSSNSIFINDSAAVSTKSTDDYENVNRMNKKGKGAYGLDNDFLKFICSWRPKVFDVADPDKQLSDRLAAGKKSSQVDSPLSPAIPSFEQFRKASGSLWERAQDLVPRQGTGTGTGVTTTPASGPSPGVSEGLGTGTGAGTGTGVSKGAGTGSEPRVGRDASDGPRTPDTRGSVFDAAERREVASEGSRMQKVAHFAMNEQSDVKDKEGIKGGEAGVEEPILLRTPLVSRGSTMTTPTTGADGIWTWTEVRSNNASVTKSEASSDYAVGRDYGIPLTPILTGGAAHTHTVDSNIENGTSKGRGRGRGRVSSSPVPPVHCTLTSSHPTPAATEGDVDGDANFSLQGTGTGHHGSSYRPMMISSDDCIVNNISLNNTSYHGQSTSRKSNGSSHRTDDTQSSTKSADHDQSSKREKEKEIEIEDIKTDNKIKFENTPVFTVESGLNTVKINGNDNQSEEGEDQKFGNLPVLGSLYPLFKDVSDNVVSPLPSSTSSPFSSPFSSSYECVESVEERKL